MAKNLLNIILITLLFVACKGKNEIAPAYIHIDKIDFKYNNVSSVGSGGSAITDAWIYDNDNLLGVFELPTTIAVATEGTHEISVRPGIKLNGISATRESFAFYEAWKKDITLIPLDTITISPSTQYFSNTQLSFNENFEDIVLKLDTATYSTASLDRTKITNQPPYLNNYVGLATLNSTKSFLKAYTKTLFMVPTTTSLPIYLELDYKCNQEFSISAILNLPGNAPQEIKSITLRSTIKDGEMQWKHIYLDLTDYFVGQTTATGFGFSFTANYNTGNPEGYIYLDNTKVVNSN